MTIKDDIYSGPVDIAKLRSQGKPAAQCVDSLFLNFVSYAKARWSYIASARAGGEALLDGSATQVPCGGLATALKILIEEKLQQQVQYVTKSGYIWTKSNYLSFDWKVKGNVCRAETPGVWDQGCFFNEHYFIKCGAKYYDPCLNSTYTTDNEAIKKQYGQGDTISNGSIMRGADADTLLVFKDDLMPVGWTRGGWMIVKERDLLRHVTNSTDLMLVSIHLKTGKLALAAREASREKFKASNRMEFWKAEHTRAGIKV